MRKYCALLALVPLASVLAIGRPPAAVFEDVFELGRAPTPAFLSTNENRNGMKAYLRKKYRHLRDPVSQASGMAAYTAAHERYQNSEETRNDRIRMENLRKVAASVRTKRLEPQPQAQQQQHHQRSVKQPKRIDIIPREVFKFELADAMVFAGSTGKSDDSEVKAIRTKRSGDTDRVEPVPRELIRFELADAVISPRKAKLLGGPRGPVNGTGTITGETGFRHRNRRSASPDPRDYVKFELEDAKTPEGYTSAAAVTTPKATAKPPVNLRHPFSSSDSYKRGKVFDEIVERPSESESPSGRKRKSSRKEKRESVQHPQQQQQQQQEQEEAVDMSPEESRRIKVRGGKKPKQIANYEDLPLGVQKAIDIAIKENERMNGKGVTVSSETGTVAPSPPPPPPSPPTTKYFFGDKKPKTKKPYSTTTKITEPKFVPSAKIAETRLPSVEEASNGETGFLPSQPMPASPGGQDKGTSSQGKQSVASSTLQGIPKAWWSYSDLRRPKRLYHKTVHQQQQQPLVISPQYVNTFKPTGGAEQSKANDLSPGYRHRHAATLFTPSSPSASGAAAGSHEESASGAYGPQEEVIIKERPRIQYVIKEIPVPVQVKQPRTKITVQPSISISYDKDITGPGSSESLRGYDNPYGPVELQYDHQQQHHPQQQQYQQPQYKEPAKSFQNMKIVIPDPKDESREQEQYYDSYENYNHRAIASTQSPPTHSNEIDTTGGSIAALSALIGQRPSVQLKGLNELLHMPVQMGNHQQQQQQQQQRPQDSTAPITFPESTTPAPKMSRPGYRSVQIENGPKIVYDDSLYHTVQMNPQLQVPMSKEYTPISEVVSDVADADLIGPTIAPPTHATYVIDTGKSTPAPIEEHHAEFQDEAEAHEGHETNAYRHINVHSTPAPPHHHHPESISHHYQEQHHHHHHHHDGASDEHYDDSEGYAFGYRVRDFHTGNDFGHVQNHDNGVTRGEYHILLPDGRVQNVRYTADEKGFHADVTYESVHPAPHQH
ncbi:uncharacterized protein LOC126574615 [Anopheles aquasalis]|uniref:uncharacterized protein LOC126574615 n=1 Tax=Anopheles aquasalis TaxID=42839 RepID=UPI00215A32D6|nr:uncharacterized protein LOC126574615 [Anopheles aquasalis]